MTAVLGFLTRCRLEFAAGDRVKNCCHLGSTQPQSWWRAEFLEVCYELLEVGERLPFVRFGVADGDLPSAFGVDAQVKLNHALHGFTSFVGEA
jgi:hypothetical protein